MLPIRKSTLTLVDLAELWSRELGGIRTAGDIHAELLRAFWLGQLPARYEGSAKGIDRVGLLRAINSLREHPGFLLVEPSDASPPKVTRHSDGSVSIDARRFIKLPADPTQWTDDVLNAAYQSLAELSLENFDPAFLPGLVGIGTTKDALAEFCDELGYPRPRFWFGSERKKNWTAGRERELEGWLRRLATGRKLKKKADYFAEATGRFPGLPRKAFNRAWSCVMPESWRRSGPIVRSRPR